MTTINIKIRKTVKRQTSTYLRFIRIKEDFLNTRDLVGTAIKFDISLPKTISILEEMGVKVKDNEYWTHKKRMNVIFTALQSKLSLKYIGQLVDLSPSRIRQIIQTEAVIKQLKAA